MPPQNQQSLSPEQLKAAGYAPVPQQIQDFLTKNSTIPQQQAQSGQLGIQSQQIKLPAEIAQSNVAVQTAPAQITSANANATVQGLEAKKDNQIAETSAYFESQKGADKKVSPSDYNDQLGKFVAAGGTSDEFDNKFQNKYVNPNNIFYDTPDNIAVRKVLPEVVNIAKSYYGLAKSGPNWEELTKLPVVGDYLKKTQFGDEIAHDQLISGLSGEIRNIVGAGQGSGVGRGIQELNNIVGLVPSSSDSKETAQSKLDKLDSFMKSVYGTSLKDWNAGQ